MKRYEMTQAQLEKLLESCRPTPVMFGSGGMPLFGTPQDNANAAWRALGEEMGFDYLTVRPTGNGDRFFNAEPLAIDSVEGVR